MARSSHILSLLAAHNYPTMQMRFICRALTNYVSGDVLDIGGALQEHIEDLLPHVHSYIVASQKYYRHDIPEAVNLEFRHMNFPPFSTFQSAQFDTVICCFSLERIKNDFLLIREIQRVLRPGGKLLVITPNQQTSLAKNPFNLREYTEDELKNLISCTLKLKETLGIYGNRRITLYRERDRRMSESFLGFDFLMLHRWIPRKIQQLPFGFLENIKRRRLLITNRKLVSSIHEDDFFLQPADDRCINFFFVAEKPDRE